MLPKIISLTHGPRIAQIVEERTNGERNDDKDAYQLPRCDLANAILKVANANMTPVSNDTNQ
jgi:hypothetical protein